MENINPADLKSTSLKEAIDFSPIFAMMKSKAVYFPNLDGLRFFCFLSVLLFHSFATDNRGIKGNPIYEVIKYRLFGNGELGVNFFFVLSGFLITYLLLKEKSQTGKVDVKKFYVRRILRIWPLYYVCLVIGFMIFPAIKLFMGVAASEPARPLYYIFLVSNFDIIHHLPDSSQLSILWSIAVEEQFYLVWPVIVAFSSRKVLPYVFLTIIAGSLVFRLFNSSHPDVIKYHTISCVSDMAVGGCAAYFSIYSKRFLWSMKWMNSFALAFIYSAGFIIYLFRHEIFFGIGLAFDRLVISLLFALIIVEQNYSANSYFKMKNLVGPSLMGQYTYGLYCLSPIGILSAHIVLSKLGWNNTIIGLIVLEGVLSLAVTIFLAVFSYHFIEKRFLELKERFAVVKTMPIVKKEIGVAEKQNVEQ